MSVAVISANLGKFEKRIWFKQKNIDSAKLVMYTDETFPPRFRSMNPRLQAKIPKCFGWQMEPGHDIYIWMDSAFALRKGGVEFMLGHLGDKDLAIFAHPHRNIVGDELDVIKRKEPYLLERYENEHDGPWDLTSPIYACGIFIYRNLPKVQQMLKEWWYHQTRYHINDQLSFPTVLKESGCTFNVISEHIYNTPYFVPMRRV